MAKFSPLSKNMQIKISAGSNATLKSPQVAAASLPMGSSDELDLGPHFGLRKQVDQFIEAVEQQRPTTKLSSVPSPSKYCDQLKAVRLRLLQAELDLQEAKSKLPSGHRKQKRDDCLIALGSLFSEARIAGVVGPALDNMKRQSETARDNISNYNRLAKTVASEAQKGIMIDVAQDIEAKDPSLRIQEIAHQVRDHPKCKSFAQGYKNIRSIENILRPHLSRQRRKPPAK